MKKVSWIVWLVLLIGLVAGAQPLKMRNITLSGLVVTGINPEIGNEVGRGEPLPGVEIEVMGTEFKTVSDGSGIFMFEEVPDGEYTLLCRKPGYKEVRHRVKVANTGLGSRTQVLMNPENAAFVGNEAVTGGSVYVAYSEKPQFENNIDSSPTKLTLMQAMAAGADISQVWGNEQPLPKSPNPRDLNMFNPITVDPNCLMVYSPEKPNKSAFVKMEMKPYWLTFNKTGSTLYVAGAAPIIQVFDALRGNKLLRNIPAQGGGSVTDLSLSPDGRYVMACVMGSRPGVMLIDTTTNLPAGFLPTPTSPWGATMIGPRVFACTGDGRQGQVVALDAASGTVVGRCKVGNFPLAIVSGRDPSRAYVACSGQSSVSVIDTLSVTEVGRIPVQVNPQRLAISPDGTRVMVSNKGSNTVSVIDTQQAGVIATIEVGKEPLGIAFSRDGRFAYVACRRSRCVQTLDGKSGMLMHTSIPMPYSVPVGLAIRP